MDTFKQHGITRESVLLLLSACVFSVFLWAFISLFNQIPALSLKLNFSELVGAMAYAVTFASIESLMVFIFSATILLSIALILPVKYFGAHMAVLGSFLIFMVSAIFIGFQLIYDQAVDILENQSLLYLGLLGLIFLLYCILIFKFPKIEAALLSALKRLSTLSLVYAFIGVLGIFIVIIRNI